MEVMVTVVVVGITVLSLVGVVGPDDACNLYALPLFLPGMSCNCTLLGCRAILPQVYTYLPLGLPILRPTTPPSA